MEADRPSGFLSPQSHFTLVLLVTGCGARTSSRTWDLSYNADAQVSEQEPTF